MSRTPLLLVVPVLLASTTPLRARASELPEVGPWDRVRVDRPDWPGAETSSASGAVLLAPPPAGTRWRPEIAPEVDVIDAARLEVAATPGVDDGADAGPFVGDLDAREAAVAMAAAPWRAEGGPRGAGVKVAVFDVQWFGAQLLQDELGDVVTHDCQEQRSCDLPMDTLRPRYAFEEGGHGMACAETVRDLAPDAELHLVRVNGPTTLENAVDWAIREDIDVVSMSMSFFHNSFHDGTGSVVDSAARLADAGILFVVSAGNYATEHWSAPWNDTDADGTMDFPWGSAWWPVYASAGSGSLQLSWDDFGACGRADLDLLVVDRDGRILGRSSATQDADGDSCIPVERAGYSLAEDGWVYAQVRARPGSTPPRIALWARGADAWRTTPGGMADPASAPTALTVGAVRATAYTSSGAEFFSSTGPTHAGLAKPDLAGPNGLTTQTYGVLGFYGTSASTPAVAGAAALVLSADPTMTPLEAGERLRHSIVSPTSWSGPALGPDGELGAGRVRLAPPEVPAVGFCGRDATATALLAPILLVSRRRRATHFARTRSPS